MKNYLIPPIAMFAFLFLISAGTNPELLSPHAGPGDLQAFVAPISGTWVAEDQADAIQDSDHGYEALNRLAFFALDIDPQQIAGQEIRIPITEYCQPAVAQYLHFRLEGDHLAYSGASFEDWSFDMAKIDYIHISYVQEGAELILTLEALEAETQNYRNIRLVRVSDIPPSNAYWQCGLQYYFISLLMEGEYQLFDPAGNPLPEDHLLSQIESKEELQFFTENPHLWPAFEAVCVRSPFDIVILRSNADQEEEIYAIEWRGNNLLLYETEVTDLNQESALPLQRGKLLYRIIPAQPLSPENLF